jgi:hypothetical protein
MFGKKKLDIYEDSRSIGITLRWFTPIAFFLLFFSIAWDGFLVFWYSLAFSGDAPWIMVLFPILHVAVGVYLTYYTLCLFFNKTFIDADSQYLTVVHKPIPWWRGNRKIPTGQVKQLYVVEKKSTGKNGVSYTYELRAKLRDGSEKDLLSLDGASSEDIHAIEEHLERFMGIEDLPVKGEYAKTQEKSRTEEPRRQGRIFVEPALSSAYFAKEGDALDLRSESLEVVGITQYDWNDGNSDKLLQTVNSGREERLLFLEQKSALLNAYRERELNIFETNLGKFRSENPPPSLVVEGQEYFPSHFKTGKGFVAGSIKGLEVKQWHYATRDQQSFVRIVSFQQTLSLYKGEKLHAADFGSALDLGKPPQRDLETRDQEWREEDLV